MDDTPHPNSQIPAAPEPMRRVPKQERSRMMVRAIVDAALRILREHGRAGLSTTALELVSGVPKASIYDYFPSLDAVVAEVFADVARQGVTAQRGHELQPGISATRIVLSITDPALGVHRELLRLDADFYRRYSGFYDLWALFDECMQVRDAGPQLLRQLIEGCPDVPPGADARMLAYALGRAVQHTSYAMLRDDPAFIDNPQFRPLLIRLGVAILCGAGPVAAEI
jgi:AcrR family transcriptional regulator